MAATSRYQHLLGTNSTCLTFRTSRPRCAGLPPPSPPVLTLWTMCGVHAPTEINSSEGSADCGAPDNTHIHCTHNDCLRSLRVPLFVYETTTRRFCRPPMFGISATLSICQHDLRHLRILATHAAFGRGGGGLAASFVDSGSRSCIRWLTGPPARLGVTWRRGEGGRADGRRPDHPSIPPASVRGRSPSCARPRCEGT